MSRSVRLAVGKAEGTEALVLPSAEDIGKRLVSKGAWNELEGPMVGCPEGFSGC